MTAFNYIEPNYKYIAIFTNLNSPRNLEIHKKNLNRESEVGYSGNWIIAQTKTFQKVLLYVRENGQNKIYLADYLDREEIEENRSRIYFENLELTGTTKLNWGDFTESKSSQSSIRYIQKYIKMDFYNNIEDEISEINELIKIGKLYSNKNLEYIQDNIENIKLNFNSTIQCNVLHYFSDSNRGYSKSDLSYLLIGLIVGEVYLMNGDAFGYGSVTATQRIIRILEREAPLRAVVMKKWAYRFGFVNHWFAQVK